MDLHIDAIEKLEKAREQGDIGQIDDNQTLWSMTEAVELIEIYQTLRDYEPSLLARKLKLVLKGPSTSGDEDSGSNLARNIAFELALVATLRHTGAFRGLSENPDIVCEAEGMRALVQCKKPLEEKNIVRDIERAAEQLRRDFQEVENDGAKGVIAISLSRILCSRFGLLRADGGKEAREIVRELVDQIAKRYQNACPADAI